MKQTIIGFYLDKEICRVKDAEISYCKCGITNNSTQSYNIPKEFDQRKHPWMREGSFRPPPPPDTFANNSQTTAIFIYLRDT